DTVHYNWERICCVDLCDHQIHFYPRKPRIRSTSQTLIDDYVKGQGTGLQTNPAPPILSCDEPTSLKIVIFMSGFSPIPKLTKLPRSSAMLKLLPLISVNAKVRADQLTAKLIANAEAYDLSVGDLNSTVPLIVNLLEKG
ncbi:MAG: hypothetical protein AAF333_10895, partial [Planctomycetota bacterium]